VVALRERLRPDQTRLLSQATATAWS